MISITGRRTKRFAPGFGSIALVLAMLGTGPAVADDLYLDFGETGSISCGDPFVLSGIDCHTEPVSTAPCYADDYHGSLLLSWAVLMVDVSELGDISHVDVLLETRVEPASNTFFGVYLGDAPVSYVSGTVTSTPEMLELETAGLVFDNVRVWGLTLTVDQMTISGPGVPTSSTTWSAVKETYR